MSSGAVVPADDLPDAAQSAQAAAGGVVPADDLPAAPVLEIGHSPGAGFGAIADVALTAGSGFLKGVTGAVNDLLPEWVGGAGSRAAVQQEIGTDPVLNYQPRTDAGQAVVSEIGKLTQPIGTALSAVKKGIANVTSPRTADVAGDIATLAGARVGASLGGDAAAEAAEGATAGLPRAAEAAPAAPAAPKPAAGFTPIFGAGAEPQLGIQGTSTAADRGVSTEFSSPTQEGTRSAPVAPDQQAARAQTLRNVGLTEARESAITGNSDESGMDFQTSKLRTDAGDRMSATITGERAGLQNYANQLVDNSGGTSGVDLSDLYERGSTIAQPIDDLHQWFRDQTSQLYAQADAAARGQPIGLPTVGGLLGQRSMFLGTVDGKQLAEGVQARMRDLGLMDESGGIQQATVQQAEQLRQYLNDQWSPRTAGLIGQLKDAIDSDVSRAAGPAVYQQARQMRFQRAMLLDDPNGIARLGPSPDGNPINRAVATEKIPGYVTTLPVDQFTHIVRTLRSIPSIAPGSDLPAPAISALNEIRGQFANQVREAGNSTQSLWNARGVSEYLRKNELRMAQVFSPQEMQQFKTLNDAGNILRMDRSYPGAAAQGHNLAGRGMLIAAKHAEAAGALLGHIPGAVIGAVVGKGAETAAGKAALSAVEKRIRKL